VIAWLRRFPPSDLAAWRTADLWPDVGAAAAVTVLSIPQGLAYAMLAGLPPAMGLYASILPAILGGLFRSSRHVVAGPTNALSLLVGTAVAGAAARTGASPVELAATLALVVGVIQMAAGALRLGALVDYLSNAVVLGYITGAAVLIAVGQLQYVTNTPMAGVDVFHRLASWLRGLDHADPRALALSIGTVAGILALRRVSKRIPGALVAIVVGVGLCMVFDLHAKGIRTIADIAPVPATLPGFTLPSLEWVSLLLPAAVATTVLSLVESGAVARSIASRTGDRIDPSMEFIGQGLANVAAAVNGGYPVSGSLGRSMANWRSGARTRLAGPIGGVFVALVVLVAGPLVDHTPLASLAGILLVLAGDLVELPRIRLTMKSGGGDIAAFLVTLVGAWVFELDKAIYLGVVVSLVLFLRRARLITVVPLVVDADHHLREAAEDGAPTRTCSAVRILHVEGSLFFGAASELQEDLDEVLVDTSVRVLILRLKRCQGLDVTTAEVLRSVLEAMRRDGRHLVLVGMRPPVMARMEALGLVEAFGRENLFPTEPGWFVAMDRAVHHALGLVGDHEADCPLRGYLAERRE